MGFFIGVAFIFFGQNLLLDVVQTYSSEEPTAKFLGAPLYCSRGRGLTGGDDELYMPTAMVLRLRSARAAGLPLVTKRR